MRPLGSEVELAELPHRIVTYQQLRLSGLSARQIQYRVEKKALRAVLPGVYTYDDDIESFLVRATALSIRYPEGFLSGAAAARYWEMRRGMPDHLEFTIPASRRPYRAEFAQFRYTSSIHEEDAFSFVDGLRVGSPVRTVFDAAGRLDTFGLRSMIQAGLDKGLFDQASLDEAGTRLCTRGRRGSRVFRFVMEAAADSAPVQSEAELILLDALRAAGLDPVPQCPVRLINGATVHLDAGFPEVLLGVEVDGPTHDDPIAVHRDKNRDFLVAPRGWQVLRPTADQVRANTRPVVAYILQTYRTRQRQLGPGTP